ncbi:sugar phosphate isomerase/epimerase family protein [Amycolatopsis sp. DG1A-15b]|uniref:sugar phosphate isomerase/epimerase family protein n=1 Tax=Amycolatopsis sp. DG1A-15b TaxID=3052846 RepID=UPI00255C150E|nr:sugar phosphate isomerase/epimerase family protein [Amycolatopsis sp. DG1A-15b]WIX92310.1 sugar phosphate isomerase/epimerase family protein [Amycolatopsis sp. DG1A-15b]
MRSEAAATASPRYAGDAVLAGITDEAAPDLAGQLAVLAELGWSAVELRTVDGLAVADLDERHFARVASTLAGHGVRVVCVASRIGGWARPITAPFADDLAELAVLARRCAVLGTRYVRIMSYPNDGLDEYRWRARVLDRVVALARAAEAAGVVLLHENCSGWAASDAGRMLQLLAAVNCSSLRLLFDTGNPVAHGYDGYEVLRRVAPHVAHVHVKDARGTTFVDPGTGEARVRDCVRLLRSAGYAGAWSLEPHVALQPHRSDQRAEGAAAAFVRAGRALAGLLR